MNQLFRKSKFPVFEAALIVVLLAYFLFTSGAYAWYINRLSIARGIFTTGRLEPKIEIQAFYKESTAQNKWTDIDTDENNGFYCYLGEIKDITQLPQDCNSYLKIKVLELSGISYTYDVSIENITLRLFDYETDEELSEDAATNVDYFSASPSQKCFDFSFFMGADGLNPLSLEYSERIQISTTGQSLLGGNYIASSNWLYIKLEPRLLELQNIFKSIPAYYMPYVIEFYLEFYGTTRSLNN